jgi:peptide-methionine (R)-S-oxide reductase
MRGPDASAAQDVADLPSWVGGASSSYEVVARERGLSFFDTPSSEIDAGYAPPAIRRYDAAWGIADPSDRGVADLSDGEMAAASDASLVDSSSRDHSSTGAAAAGAAAAGGVAPSARRRDVRVSRSGFLLQPLGREAVEAGARALGDDVAREVLLEGGTERPHSHEHTPEGSGWYRCAIGGLPLFHSSARRPSTTGWPSFAAPIDPHHVIERSDWSTGSERTEVLCARSRCHLGHVFDLPGGASQGANSGASQGEIPGESPGEIPGASRSASQGESRGGNSRERRRYYCINGAALRFEPRASEDAHMLTLVLAGGCFWGLQHTLLCAAGVVDAEAGYARVESPSPPPSSSAAAASLLPVEPVPSAPSPVRPLLPSELSYERVRAGSSGWFEAVGVRVNIETASIRALLDHFFRAHDPTAGGQSCAVTATTTNATHEPKAGLRSRASATGGGTGDGARESIFDEPWQEHYASAVLIPHANSAVRQVAAESARDALAAVRAGARRAGRPEPAALATTIAGGEPVGEEQPYISFVRAEETQQRYLAKRGKPIVVHELPGRTSLQGSEGTATSHRRTDSS